MRPQIFIVLSVVSIASLAIPSSARAASFTFKVLASFNGANGRIPSGPLLVDGQGNLFGTTAAGGATDQGTIFQLRSGTTTPVALASFNGANGSLPDSGLIADSQGNLFGTAPVGGANGQGVVFEVTAGDHAIIDLVNFDGVNGDTPFGGVVADAQGNFYGTTKLGGINPSGSVFKLPAGSSTPITLASFTTTGLAPTGVVLDRLGNLFGATLSGGANTRGSLFKVPAGGNAPTTLASFNVDNGAVPGGLLADSNGNLFGLAQVGGNDNPDGSIFKLAAGTNTISFIASFNGANGDGPVGLLIADAQGNLFGATVHGGANGLGNVFELPVGSSTPISLFDFDGTNGRFPASGLVADSHGNLFGTTPSGGLDDNGLIFELSPASSALRGDFNLDGRLTSADIPAMLQSLTDLKKFQADHMLSDPDLLAIGDLTGDNKVTNADIQGLINLLANGGGSGAGSLTTVPEPNSLALVAIAGLTVIASRRR